MGALFRDVDGTEYALAPRTAKVIRMIVSLTPRWRTYASGEMQIRWNGDAMSVLCGEFFSQQTWATGGTAELKESA